MSQNTSMTIFVAFEKKNARFLGNFDLPEINVGQ
jgi:hypothetical protein